jgi:CheY-like chemotaxis protein
VSVTAQKKRRLLREHATLFDASEGVVMAETVPKTEWGPAWPYDRATDARPERPCVLVVDDDPVNLMLACEMLSFCGTKPLAAADGAEAVALACELRLDLILMDLQMPVLDGYSATQQIRRFEREHARTRVPVVAYTSTRVSADQPHLRDIGIDAVLHKPGDARTFQECVMRWCFPAGHTAAPEHTGRLSLAARSVDPAGWGDAGALDAGQPHLAQLRQSGGPANQESKP